MAKFIRVGDMSAGHVPTGPGPRPAVTGSPNVNIEGKAAVRVGDKWQGHHTPPFETHAAGSSKILINGKAAAMTNTLISCGEYSGPSGSTSVNGVV